MASKDVCLLLGDSMVAQMVKHLPTMRDTWVQSWGREDLLEKEMATHSMDGGAWWATVHGVTKSQTRLSNFTFFSVRNVTD